MAWYDDDRKLNYVAVFKDEKEANREIDRASKKGWMPQGVAATDGHVNVGRTATTAVLTVGISLLFGASRTKGTVTITFVRTPDWLKRHRKD